MVVAKTKSLGWTFWLKKVISLISLFTVPHDAGLQWAAGLLWFVPFHDRQKEQECWNWKQSCCLRLPFYFCQSQWMPNRHYNGWVSLYRKVFGWLMLLNARAFRRTLNLTVIFWLPQVKNTKCSSFPSVKMKRKKSAEVSWMGKSFRQPWTLSQALSCDANICYLLVFQITTNENTCFVEHHHCQH